jgi:hypothetical protein
VFIAIPDFFWAILAVLLFASWLHLLPATGYAPLAMPACWQLGRASRAAGSGAVVRPCRACLAPHAVGDDRGAAKPLRARRARQGF